MSLNQRTTSEVLSRLDWYGGLTRDDILKQIQQTDDMDASDLVRLFRSLPEGRRFETFEEAVEAVLPSNWEK
ncbi:MAG: hypothetical protein HYX94_02105 [Chloroflexi bacterium]|nr:hypothetical protein [Chloroflexota bacterium]